MSNSLWAMALIVSLGGGPYDCQTCNGGMSGSYVSGGFAGGYGNYGGTSGGIYSTGMGLNGYSGSNGDVLLPWDTQEAWMHGYFQEIGPYAGYHHFRPYNYKHVFAQADLAYRWGQPHGMPYSQQWWHRYHARAALNPAAQQQMSQATSAYDVEMARLRAWRDFQAEQQRVGYSQPSANPPSVVFDPASQAALEQPSGARALVVPAAPVSTIPRSAQAPVIQEFKPQGNFSQGNFGGPILR